MEGEDVIYLLIGRDRWSGSGSGKGKSTSVFVGYRL